MRDIFDAIAIFNFLPLSFPSLTQILTKNNLIYFSFTFDFI